MLDGDSPKQGRRALDERRGTTRLSFARLQLVFAVAALFGVACAAPTIEEEEALAESAIVSASGGACPVDARVSQGFKGKSHDGIDLANKIGTPIYAVMGGVVTASGPAQGYGQWIRISHSDGSMTEYGHMSKRFVEVGAKVKAGQKIAAVGKEGRSTGPHLHLRTYRSASKTGAGSGMDPVQYLKQRGVSIPCKPRGIVDGDAPAPETQAGSDSDVDDEKDDTPLTSPQQNTPDGCASKTDGWYCSDEDEAAAYYCKAEEVSDRWFCSDETVCRPNASGGATLYGKNPGCFGKR